MTKKKPESVYTALRIPAELREKAERKAEDEGRSLSNYIKFLITRDLGLKVRESDSGYPGNGKK
jgi:predicted HicB family RNase H-like nuclease